MGIKGLPKYVRKIEKLKPEDFLSETPEFMAYCDTIVAQAEEISHIADNPNKAKKDSDNGASNKGATNPPDANPFSLDSLLKEASGARDEDKKSATLLTICERYGGVLAQCLSELRAEDKEIFLSAINKVNERLVETAFSGVFVGGLSYRGRAALIKAGIRNIVDCLGSDVSEEDMDEEEEAIVFLDICDEHGDLLFKCLNGLSTEDKNLFLTTVSEGEIKSMISEFRHALIDGLTAKEREILIRKGINTVLAKE